MSERFRRSSRLFFKDSFLVFVSFSFLSRQRRNNEKNCQMACKPGSVQSRRTSDMAGLASGHHSHRTARGWPFIWDARCRAPRATYPRIGAERRLSRLPGSCPPIWSCSRWGLPCRWRYRQRGALLPHLFTLTGLRPLLVATGGLVSVALSLGSLPPGVTRHRPSMEPGLSSLATREGQEQPSSHLATSS